MALYELLLLGQGRPELRLTDCVLALDDLVEVADRRWRVQRMSPPSGEDVELRYVLILEPTDAREAQPARRRPRVIKADLADARDKSGVLWDAAGRVRNQAQRVGNRADQSPTLCPTCHRRVHRGSDGESNAELHERLAALATPSGPSSIHELFTFAEERGPGGDPTPPHGWRLHPSRPVPTLRRLSRRR